MSKAGRMAASNVLLLKKSGDRRQEQALQEAFKVFSKSKLFYLSLDNILQSLYYHEKDIL